MLAACGRARHAVRSPGPRSFVPAMAAAAGPIVLPDLQRRIAASRARARPFVTLTYAQSLDGSISAIRGEPLRLSGDASMTMTHQLRAMHDGIMVGVATMIADNPSLTVRLVPGQHPRPLILDSTLRTPLGCKLLTSDSCVKPIILTTAAALEAAAERRDALLAAGAEIIACAATADGHVDLGDALLRLPASCRSVMVEGGAAVITSLLDSAARGLGTWIDYLLLTIAPVIVGGLRGELLCCVLHCLSICRCRPRCVLASCSLTTSLYRFGCGNGVQTIHIIHIIHINGNSTAGPAPTAW